jgi:hypothetical protein
MDSFRFSWDLCIFCGSEGGITSTYDQICDGFSLLLLRLFVAISTKAKFFFCRNNFVTLSMIQVCMETLKELSIHVSPPLSSVNPLHRRNSNEISSQVQQTTMAITTEIFYKSKTYDVDIVCAMKNHGNL